MMSQLEAWSLLKIDQYVSEMMLVNSKDNNLRVRVLRLFLKLLEYSGHGIPWITATLYVIYMDTNMETRQFFCNLLMALLVDLVIVGFLKTIVRRPRPAYNVDDMFATVSVDKYSFPSGHSTRVAMVAMLFTHYWTNRVYIQLGLLWAAMVAISRVMLGRHHVSDVISGVTIGYAQYCLVLKCWLMQTTLEQILDTFNFYRTEYNWS